jgi:hypothetical protein
VALFRVALSLSSAGAHAQAGDVVQHLADAVEFRDGFRDGAHGCERFDEARQPAQVVEIGCLDDVAKEDYYGGEGDVDYVPLTQSVGS